MEGIGPCGEPLLKYSVYDALRRGFTDVVFVIRESMRDDFQKIVLDGFENQSLFKLSFQEIDRVPSGFSVPAGRTKPWGTAHALWCAKEEIDAPFAVINADDFYSCAAFEALSDALPRLDALTPMCMVGYRLRETLSMSGSVSRGVCTVEDGYLVSIEEHTDIERREGVIVGKNAKGEERILSEKTIVSMNCWGFAPSFMSFIDEEIAHFFAQQGVGSTSPSEAYLPSAVQRALAQGARCRVLETQALWCGVTYPEDKQLLQALMRDLVEWGIYPVDIR